MHAINRKSKIIECGGKKVWLTGRELDVLMLIGSGYSYLDAGNQLFVSWSTINFHMVNIRGKLQVKNRVQAFQQPSVSS
jgi:ATP/maltotriose-dependent transcriptional regulator MalT